MDIHFMERTAKNAKMDTMIVVKDDEEVEEIAVPFEAHPHEISRSVAERYSAHRVKYYGALLPPPGMHFFLRDAARGTYLNPGATMQEIVKEGSILFTLGARF